MKLKLIEEWKHGWKFLSVQLGALAVAIQYGANSLPPWAHDAIPAAWWQYISICLFIAAAIGRFVKQDNVPTGKDQP